MECVLLIRLIDDYQKRGWTIKLEWIIDTWENPAYKIA